MNHPPTGRASSRLHCTGVLAPRHLVSLLLTTVLAAGSLASAAENFNVLEAASLSPSGELELFGKNDPNGPKTPIPFRQVLHEALAESGAPQFSLDSDFSQFTRQALAGKSMQDLFYSEPGRLGDFGRAVVEALQIPPPEDARADFTALLLRQAGYSGAADLHAAMAPGETRPSSETRARWVRILGLTGDLRSYLDAVAASPAGKQNAADRFYIKLLDGMARSMAPQPPRLANIYRAQRSSGESPDRALLAAQNKFVEAYAALTVRAVSILQRRHGLAAIVLDGPALKSALGVNPVSRPRFVNLDPTSQLARILLEGDVALKSLPLDSSLTDVPGYRTFPDWARSTIGPEGLGSIQTNRLWISLDGARVEIRESEDGTIASFGRVEMKVDSRSKDADEPWSAERNDRQTQGYADLLTEHFSALAQRVPALHQLREAAKVVALAKWIRTKQVRPVLDYEPLTWTPPTEVKGFLAMVPSESDGRLYWGVLPSGGVDFDFELVVTKDPTLTLESLRRGSQPPARLDELRRDALREEAERLRKEAERTRRLEEKLQEETSAEDKRTPLTSHFGETTELRAASLKETSAGFSAAVSALRRLPEEVDELEEHQSMALLAALTGRPPKPPLDSVRDGSDQLLASLVRLENSAAAFQTPLVAEVRAMESWMERLQSLNIANPKSLSNTFGLAPSLEVFAVETLGALVAFSLYREFGNVQRVLREDHDATTGVAGLRLLREGLERLSEERLLAAELLEH